MKGVNRMVPRLSIAEGRRRDGLCPATRLHLGAAFSCGSVMFRGLAGGQHTRSLRSRGKSRLLYRAYFQIMCTIASLVSSS